MKKSSEKRGRGRPRTDWTAIGLTLQPRQLEKLDAWIEQQGEGELSRPEAVRRLLDQALAAAPKRGRTK
jgi:hypothetical protein